MTKRQIALLRKLFGRRQTGFAGRSRVTTPEKGDRILPLIRQGLLERSSRELHLTNAAFRIAIAEGWTPPVG